MVILADATRAAPRRRPLGAASAALGLRGLLAQMCEQARSALLHQIEHALEIRALAVVRIRHFTGARLRRKVEEQRQACARLHRRHCPQGLQVRAIHRQYEIELVEIFGLNGTCPQVRQIVSPLLSRRACARIRRIANVVVGSACGVDSRHRMHVLPRKQSAEHTLGCGRATDIAEADKQHFHPFIVDECRLDQCQAPSSAPITVNSSVW